MINLQIFQFDENELEVIIVDGEPWFNGSHAATALGYSNAARSLSDHVSDKYTKTVDLKRPGKKPVFINEPGLYQLIMRSQLPAASRFQDWVFEEVLPSIRKTRKYEAARATLESQVQPVASIKEIKEAYLLYKKAFGDAYSQRYLMMQMSKHQPHLAGHEPEKEEWVSLSSAALLTPTQIAAQLGINYKSGSPNPQAVNNLLEQLGYQTKIEGQWSATEKAKGLCDRKPVSTGSKSQKDQLLWSDSIIDVLREHL